MPTYTYRCSNEECSVVAEKVRKIDERDDPLLPCPSCGSELKRGLDRPGLVWAPTAGGYR